MGYEARDSFVRELAETHDTLREVTMVTVQTNEAGDTVFRSVVTDRTRASDRSRADRATYRTMVKTDTVYVEKRDSSLVRTTNFANDTNGKPNGFVSALRWIFAIIVALIGLKISPFLWRREKK